MPISSGRLQQIFADAERDKNPLAQAFVVGFSKLFPADEIAADGDNAKALPHLLKASEDMGSYKAIPEAIFLLSIIHPEEAKRLEYLQAASALGFGESTINLAVFYVKGDDTHHKKAVDLLHLPHLSDNPIAKIMLGKMYEKGVGVEKNSNKALKLYIEAERLGHKAASDIIAKFESTSVNSAMTLGDYYFAKGNVNKAAQCYVDAFQFHAQFASSDTKILPDDLYRKLNNLPYDSLVDGDLCFEIANIVFTAREYNSKSHCFLVRAAELEHRDSAVELEAIREAKLRKLNDEENPEGKQVDAVIKNKKEIHYQSQLAIAGYFHHVIEDYNAAVMWYVNFCSKEIEGRFAEEIATGRARLESIALDQITDLAAKLEVAIYYLNVKVPGWQLKTSILLVEAARGGIRLAHETIVSCVAVLDEPDVRFMLGNYFKEIGDIDNAIRAYYSAKEKGHEPASMAFEELPAAQTHYVVGSAYSGGDHQALSDEHMIMAARAGNKLAMHHLVATRASNKWIDEQKIAIEEVLSWIVTAASDPEFYAAHYSLGGMYLFGRLGLPIDADLAVADMERSLFATYPQLRGEVVAGAYEVLTSMDEAEQVSFGRKLSSLALGYITQGRSEKAVEIYALKAPLDYGIGRNALAHYMLYTQTGNIEYLRKTQELINAGMEKTDIACVILRTFFYGISTNQTETNQASANIKQLIAILALPNNEGSVACMRNFAYCAIRNQLGFLAVLDLVCSEICTDVVIKSGKNIMYRKSDVQKFIDEKFTGIISRIKTALLGGQKSEGEEFVSLDILRTKVFTTEAEKLKLFDFICRSKDNPRIYHDLCATAIPANVDELAGAISTIAHQTAWKISVAVETVTRLQTAHAKKPGADALILKDLRKEAGIAKSREVDMPFHAIRSYLRKQKIMLTDEQILEALRDTHVEQMEMAGTSGAGRGGGGGGGGRG